jgi:hypothetical protein
MGTTWGSAATTNWRPPTRPPLARYSAWCSPTSPLAAWAGVARPRTTTTTFAAVLRARRPPNCTSPVASSLPSLPASGGLLPLLPPRLRSLLPSPLLLLPPPPLSPHDTTTSPAALPAAQQLLKSRSSHPLAVSPILSSHRQWPLPPLASLFLFRLHHLMVRHLPTTLLRACGSAHRDA